MHQWRYAGRIDLFTQKIKTDVYKKNVNPLQAQIVMLMYTYMYMMYTYIYMYTYMPMYGRIVS